MAKNRDADSGACGSGDASLDCRSRGCGPTPLGRREFIQLAGVSAASLLGASSQQKLVAGPFSLQDTADHFVPADKKLAPEWVETLFAKGDRTFYQGGDLAAIAMPVGGICAGQLYLTGDGRLVHWDIFNQHLFSGYGRDNYESGRKMKPVLQQGFAIRAGSGGKTVRRTLDADGFSAQGGVRFCGEYPIATVEYRDDDLPVAVTLEAFSPFIPLDAPDSALPATVMRFTLKNTSGSAAEVTLAGWLENGVSLQSGETIYGVRRNRVKTRPGLTMVVGSARQMEPPRPTRPPIVLADFEGDDYGDWTVEGESVGKGPAHGTLGRQQAVSGFLGKGLVNTFSGGDKPHGKLTSPEFTIERSFLRFLIGGGKLEGRTCVNLIVDGKVVRTATGKNSEKLDWHIWNVRELDGKKARIEIVDAESGAWGHVSVDQIELCDTAGPTGAAALLSQPDFGTMALAILDDRDVLASPCLPDGPPEEGIRDWGLGIGEREIGRGGDREKGRGPDPPGSTSVSPSPTLPISPSPSTGDSAEKPFGEPLVGALGKTLTLAPGQQAQVAFLVTWCFPNRPDNGNFYATWHADAESVAAYVAGNFDRLAGQTRLWHQTWYDSSLPHWLLDRLFSTVSILATSTCQWWANGRFWAWEGVGCCRGTCAHVWNYEHAMARLFPRLERSVREMQDFNPDAGFDPQTGMVRFRGEGWKMWAGDAQAGTVLKAYREHLVSPDDQFLRRNWPRIRKALEFLIHEDGNSDGLLEGAQHNTYDIEFYGPNTMVGSLYLAALRAAEEMARRVGEPEFADACRAIFERGRKLTVERLWGGEYFVQKVDLKEHPKFQYGDGCLSDQLFGQGWADQVGLGYVYPQETVKTALQSIWKYNWAPDVAPQNEAHKPERWFAKPGEAGLFTCTWPKSPYLADAVRYRNEVWTGIEYQVAGNMAFDGMLTEALAICRAVDERYHPSKRNPFNEIECGDHYARAMASYGVFLALCGFEYDGPSGHLGFAPRLGEDDFRAAFSASEGWGTFSQQRAQGRQTNRIEVRWGRLRVSTLAFELPEGAALKEASVALSPFPVQSAQDGRRVTVTFSAPVIINEGASLEVTLTM